MMSRLALVWFFMFVLLLATSSFHEVDSLHVPSSKIDLLKRAASKLNPVRSKRYTSCNPDSPDAECGAIHRRKRSTDYQERASAMCTGLCMYEERKSYSDCFDLCNYY